ncbi:MAG: hypothetical protein VKL59_12445 [Nostocaceae cyanobacterium]|nr:hypothetical protein [Nostocaceae cyanobacterium]
MNSSDNDNNSLERRERLVREIETELRLRELEAEINPVNQTIHKTVKHQPKESRKIWLQKAVLGLKLLAVGVLALVAAKLASFLAAAIIILTLMFVSYKLFFSSEKKS